LLLIIHGGVLGVWAECVIVGGSQLKKLGNPLESDLEKIIATPGYEGKVEFIDQFPEDFKKILAQALTPTSIYLPIVLDGIARAQSAFEQYQALNLATQILGSMTEDQKLALRTALLQQEGVPIDQSDSSRWSFREKLLAEIGPR
jgi:hypothetical protein